MPEYFTRDLADEAATLDFGRQLAHALVPNLTIFMQGNLGAGKTTMTRGLLRGLGFEGKVKSPTYTLLETYEISLNKTLQNSLELSLNHFDLYRFNDDEEWEMAGFRDAFNAQSVCIIEWPEKAINCLPTPDIEVILAMQGDGRQVTLQAHSEKGQEVCDQVIAQYT